MLSLHHSLKIMIIMRGLPGSGKSTLANKIMDKYRETSVCAMCSGDEYFTDKSTGKYNFDVNKLKDAHGYAQKKAENACKSVFCLFRIFLEDF
jgi:uridine kinase